MQRIAILVAVLLSTLVPRTAPAQTAGDADAAAIRQAAATPRVPGVIAIQLAHAIGARVVATAGPGEIVVSRTVRDLVAGSDVVLQDRGSQRLKGVEGGWQLFGVVGR